MMQTGWDCRYLYGYGLDCEGCPRILECRSRLVVLAPGPLGPLVRELQSRRTSRNSSKNTIKLVYPFAGS